MMCKQTPAWHDPMTYLSFQKKLTKNNSKQIKMNETELKSYEKNITARNLLIKAIKLLNLGEKHSYQITVR